MHKITARSLLLLMLITVFGQVMAQPCAEIHGNQLHGGTAMDVPSTHPLDHGSNHPGMQQMSGEHCASSAPADSHCGKGMAPGEECSQGCTCCPGHCASALPTAESGPNLSPRSHHKTAYSEIASSPEPETAIRPPIFG